LALALLTLHIGWQKMMLVTVIQQHCHWLILGHSTGVIILSKPVQILQPNKVHVQKINETKYHDGVLPVDTYKKEVDELVPHKDCVDWPGLREQLKATGIRNSTLMALMPAETSQHRYQTAQTALNRLVRYVSIKQSKDGVLKQVVPEYPRLKNKYELLWDQKITRRIFKNYCNFQKYIDQGISVNTSYNPQHYEDEKIPNEYHVKTSIIVLQIWGETTLLFQHL
jgi:ribonucleoside-diphosphate reductase alpha chain